MAVNRQTCQACGSLDVRNILVRGEGAPTRVYVRCSHCQELVASYTLRDYYHHGKGIESYLRGQGATAGDSGRQWLAQFERAQEEAQAGYAAALAALAEAQKDI